MLGLAVLGAIVGGLFAYDRLSGDDSAGRVESPGTASLDLLPTDEPGLGPLDGAAPRIGQAAPDFALRGPDGDVQRLSDLRGNVVWINFWATWCGPCRRELPDIQALADEFRDDGLVVLALNFQESTEQALSFWEELDLDLPVLMDSSGSVADQYRLRGFPDSFFIDRDGILRALQIGFLTEGEMRDKLAAAGLS